MATTTCPFSSKFSDNLDKHLILKTNFFSPLAWLGLNSGTNSAATSADPMAAFSSTASTSSLPAPSYSPFHHHHHHLQPLRPHALSPFHHLLHHHHHHHQLSPLFSYPSPSQFHTSTGVISTASKQLSSSPSATTTTTQPLYRIMVPVQSQPSPSAIYRSLPSPAYHQMISNIGSSSSGQLKPPSIDEMMPSDVTPDINGNFKRAGAHGHLLHHHHQHHQHHPQHHFNHHPIQPNQSPLDEGDDPNSYFFGDPTPLLRGTGYTDQHDQSGSSTSSSSMATAESSNSPQSYYYIAPVIKYRDPKDDFNLGSFSFKTKTPIYNCFHFLF